MGCKGGNANPVLVAFLHVHHLGQHTQVTAFLGEDAGELNIHGVAQLAEYVQIVLERRRLLCQFLVFL